MRRSKGLTQKQAADFVGIPLRTYCYYENDPQKQNTLKYRDILNTLNSFGYVDETAGILSIETIKEVCANIFSRYPVEYCYLFGSYAKGKATPTSDVDLYICTPVSGLQFFALAEDLREQLKKKVDLLNQTQIQNNFDLINEILKDGIKIYG